MVSSLLHPLNIFIVGLGGGFLIPLVYRLGQVWVCSRIHSCSSLHDADLGRLPARVFSTARAPIEILTAARCRRIPSICAWACRKAFSPSASI